MLIDDGLVTQTGVVGRGGRARSSVPPTIQALLAARVDRLTTDERAVLEAAAVVGQEFFVGAVMELAPADDHLARTGQTS